MRNVFTVLLALLAQLSPLPARAGLDLDASVFTEPALGLRLRIPPGWRASTQTGYPGLLLVLQTAGRGSRIVLGGDEVGRETSLARFVAESISGLRALGMSVTRSQGASLLGRSAWELVARTGRDTEVRQLILWRTGRVFTVTLAGPCLEIPHLLPELQQVLAGLDLR